MTSNPIVDMKTSTLIFSALIFACGNLRAQPRTLETISTGPDERLELVKKPAPNIEYGLYLISGSNPRKELWYDTQEHGLYGFSAFWRSGSKLAVVVAGHLNGMILIQVPDVTADRPATTYSGVFVPALEEAVGGNDVFKFSFLDYDSFTLIKNNDPPQVIKRVYSTPYNSFNAFTVNGEPPQWDSTKIVYLTPAASPTGVPPDAASPTSLDLRSAPSQASAPPAIISPQTMPPSPAKVPSSPLSASVAAPSPLKWVALAAATLAALALAFCFLRRK